MAKIPAALKHWFGLIFEKKHYCPEKHYLRGLHGVEKH